MRQVLPPGLASGGVEPVVVNVANTPGRDELSESGDEVGGVPQACVLFEVRKEAFGRDPKLTNLLLDPYFQSVIERCQDAWRRVAAKGIELGIPLPAFTTALNFYDGYRTARLPENLLQAQRDYFSAHTYERLDTPRGKFFHMNWTGEGMDVASDQYNA
jgi:6-phosphogluconate dehydrogenase